MPRYFFTIRGRDRVKGDRQGTSLPDIAAALSNAERKIRELRKREQVQQRSDPDDDRKKMEPGRRYCPCRSFRGIDHLGRVGAPRPSRTHLEG